MGTIVRFPQVKQKIANAAGNSRGRGKAAIVILPVIRIERNADHAKALAPSRTKPGAKHRRRTLRE
jgi:hypothetical protein